MRNDTVVSIVCPAFIVRGLLEKVMEFEIRPVTPDLFPQFARTTEAAFGGRPSDEDLSNARVGFEFDRSLAVFDGARIVGSATAYSFELTLPGLTTLPAAGVSWVGVLPTYRRRGILRAMMRRQLDDVRQRGEALAILTASESVIYGRFGYGVATSVINVELDQRHAAFIRPVEFSGHLQLVEHESAMALLPEVYNRVRRLRPGHISRSTARWQDILRDPDKPLDGAGPRFYVAYESAPGQVDGVAIYRVKGSWEGGLASSTLLLREIIATTTEAATALWHYCLNVDLVTTVRATNRPVDEPLRWLLADPRRLRVMSLGDDLWLRVLDVPAALAARRYTTSDRLALEISDPFCPDNSGCYRLEGGPDGATCRRSDEAPDVVLDIADLGAVYLGGVAFSALSWAGRAVERTPGALRRADLMFACAPVPWCATSF